MRVLHVITGLGLGGAEQQLRLLLRNLPEDCEVVTLANPGPVADAIRADGTPVHVLLMRGNRDLAVLPRLVKLMRAGRFDVVHTHLYRACVYGRLAARLAGIRRVVATEHSLNDGIIEGRATTRGVRVLYKASERLGTGTIAVSEAVAGRLRAWGVNRVRVIPNGIDAAEFAFDPALRAAARSRLGIAANARVVGAVGRLDPTKCFDRLVRAIADVADVTLLLVGDGPARASLEALVASLGLSERVIFAGGTPDVRELLCAMDVLASPSDRETFGLAILEALACGLPVVYASCPPLEELSPGFAPAALRVDDFASALRDIDYTQRLPVPPAVAHYDISRLAGAVRELYQGKVQK
jgi:glycosyltransferase involved in cell wall biosynthesis